MSLDPNDVLPRRNLPPEAENWGRTLERRQREVMSRVGISQQGVNSHNRSFASRWGHNIGQLERLSESLEYMELPGHLDNTHTGEMFTPVVLDPPEWATSAMVEGFIYELNSTTLSSDGLNASVYLYNDPEFHVTDNQVGDYEWFSSVGVSRFDTPGYFTPLSYSARVVRIGEGGALYLGGRVTGTPPKTGTVDVTWQVVMTWL